MEYEKCVICKKLCSPRCIGGDRYKKVYLKEFEINFESIYEDHWKGYYFLCWECLGKHKKKKQKQFLSKFKDLREAYLENGSPTWRQSGVIECINFFINGTKDIVKSPNTLDGDFEAWLRGTFEVFDDIKKKTTEGKG